MTIHPNDPLSAEERALADQLARSAPGRLPPPAVDAAILHAAHAASRPPAMPRRPRWPTVAGIAATLVLAIGVAWQLRPVSEAPDVQEEHAGGAAARGRSVRLDHCHRRSRRLGRRLPTGVLFLHIGRFGQRS